MILLKICPKYLTNRNLFLLKKSNLIKFQYLNFKTSTYKQQNGLVKSNWFKYFGMFLIGSGVYFLYDKYNTKKSITKIESSSSDEPTIKLDLNEIYERNAVLFLSNPELREVIGLPIKITTSNEIDQVRTVNLRRESNDLYAFIAYDLQGSINSGILYCKLKMDKNTQIFKSESMLLKLSKPDAKNRKEIIIKAKK